MKKHIANILTASRIVLALFLLVFFKKISVFFIIIYTIAEFTDIIDGTIARKTGSCSQTGALLDSVADILLALNLVKVLFTMKLIKRKIAVWLFVTFGIGAISPIINFIKHKKVFFIHSITCKICGGIISAIPFAIFFGFIDTYLIFALAWFSFSMIEICVMSVIMDKPDPDAKSIYSLVKAES